MYHKSKAHYIYWRESFAAIGIYETVRPADPPEPAVSGEIVGNNKKPYGSWSEMFCVTLCLKSYICRNELPGCCLHDTRSITPH